MASPIPKTRSTSRPQPQKSSGRSNQPTQPAPDDHPEIVDPVWLLKAVGVTILAAIICGYLTLCLLFYQGQWQLVLHPSHTTPAPAAIAGASFQTVHFGIDDTATPQLTGWLIPAEPSARYATHTILYLPSGDGSLADSISTLVALHETGINVFAFDYRGYGQSAPTHPNQKRMTEDAGSAWRYLAVSRAMAPSRIVLFGSGVGAAIATQLAIAHPESPAVILESPRPDVILDVLADPRVKSLPVRVLFDQSFDITGSVANLKTPKLFLLGETQYPSAGPLPIQNLTAAAAFPKVVATMKRGNFYGPLYREQILRFLDQYLK